MESGLTSKEAEKLSKIHGKNEIVFKRKLTWLSIFASQFPTLINAILLSAAVFSFLIGQLLDASFILGILFLSSFFGFLQEYRAEKALEKLKDYVTPLSRVFRNGKETQIPTVDLVPADIVVLVEGERVPADGKIATKTFLEVDESVLTGESIPVFKETGDLVFSSTLVTKGKAHILVEKIGSNTRFGLIAKALSETEADKTPLQKRLNHLGKIVSVAAILIAFTLIPVGLTQGKQFFSLVLLSVSASVAVIPEGLPAVITIALALGVAKMARKKTIIRKMPAIETLGVTQVILMDKTGTLTQNRMKVKKIELLDKKFLDSLLKACVLGNTATIIQKVDHATSYEIVGDKTDAALLVFAKEKVDLEKLKSQGQVLDEFVFDPQNKIVTTVFGENLPSQAGLPAQAGKKTMIYVRGAPEVIIEKSKLSQSQKEKIRESFENFAKEGLRVIAFAQKEEEHYKKSSREHFERNLEFLGFVGIYDPPREEAKDAVEKAKQAGIRIVMVTGDNELTALSIAKEVGLIEKDEDVVTGEELDRLKDSELEKIIPKVRIFARITPEDKLRLVSTFKKLGFIVGVTGDGVNDSLALKRADVGIAVGSGTDVAKEASDIILLDDNFATLVSAIHEGRTIYNNILKSITYLLSGNLSEISLIFFAAILKFPDPLLPTQILWINLVTDGLPALALSSDRKEEGTLKENPRDPKESILTRDRMVLIGVVGFGLSFLLLFAFAYLLKSNPEVYSRTVIFNLLVLSHMAIAFFIRGKNILKLNKFLIFAILLTVVLQITITTVPFFQEIFHLGF